MNLHITKSKNAESFYIAKSYVKANGSTSSAIVRKLGTLDQLIVEHGPTREDVLHSLFFRGIQMNRNT